MDDVVFRDVSFVAFILSSGLLAAVVLRRPLKRWWMRRQAAINDARVIVKKYGDEAHKHITERLASAADEREARHLQRVLRFIPGRS